MEGDLKEAKDFLHASSDKGDLRDGKRPRSDDSPQPEQKFKLTNLGQNPPTRHLVERLIPDLPPEKAQPGTQSFSLSNLGGSKPVEFKIEGKGTYKMALCMYYETKGCGKGDTCTYAHGEEELRQNIERQGGFNKSVMCKFFEQGSCRNGKACRFAHSLDEIKESAPGKEGGTKGGATPATVKTLPCKFFENGYCGRGELCSFAHGESVIQAAKAQDAEKTMEELLSQEAQQLMGQGLSSEDAQALAAAKRGKGKGGSTSSSDIVPGFKTKMCSFHLEGKCQKGSDCTFAHGPEELHGGQKRGKREGNSRGMPPPPPPPPPSKRLNPDAMSEIEGLMCPLHQHGSCKEGDQCNLAHSVDDIVAGLIACGVCTLHLVTECAGGDICRFAHVSEDQKACIDSMRPCKFYSMGSCFEGDACRYLHEKSSAKAESVP